MAFVLLVLVLVTPICVFIAKAPPQVWDAISERIKNPPERTNPFGKAGYYDWQVAREQAWAKENADSKVKGIKQAEWIIKEARSHCHTNGPLQARMDAWLTEWEGEDPFDEADDEAGPDDDTTVMRPVE